MFNRFQSLVRDYFGFSHKESRGFLVLLFLLLLCLLVPFLYRALDNRNPVDTSVADQRKLDSLVALMRTEEARQPAFADRSEREKTTTERFSEPKLFQFDPNTVSVAGWQQLGLPRWMAERIDKYRSKGGQFRKKEDLLKIYDFPPDLYDQLEPYIALKETPRSDRFNNDRFGAGKPDGSETNKSGDRSAFTDRPVYADRPAKPGC